jgi:hypothetical protein
MKTSNYISISYLVFLFGGIFVLFIGAKIHSLNEPAVIWTWQEKAISPFSVVVAEPGADFSVQYDQNSKIGLSFQKGDSCIYPPVEIRHDTLFVHPYDGKVKQQSVIVFGSGIKTVQGKENSTIELKRFGGDTLVVKLNKAVFKHFPDNNQHNKFSLIIHAAESNIQLGSASIQSMELHLSKTEMTGRGTSVSNLTGILNDHSTLSIGHMKKINLDTDSTSTYQFYKSTEVHLN